MHIFGTHFQAYLFVSFVLSFLSFPCLFGRSLVSLVKFGSMLSLEAKNEIRQLWNTPDFPGKDSIFFIENNNFEFISR